MTSINIIYTNGQILTLPAASVETADFSLSYAENSGVHTITLTPTASDLRLTAVEYVFDLPETLLTPAEEVYVFDNNEHTNDIARVIPYKGNETHEYCELGVFKNLATGEVLLTGLVTALRFWASMFQDGTKMTVRFELEDRLLNAGETYVMERFMIAGGINNENALMETYADRVAELMHAIPTGDLPTGWCSWSCYYGNINEEKIRRAADMQVKYASAGKPNLVQIDDGWQRCGSFCGEWVANERFPSGMQATADYVISKGLTFGLWLAPCMMDDQSDYYEELKDITMPMTTMGDRYHPFNLGHPRYHEHLRKTFTRMTKEFHASYFKLDFLAASIRYFNGQGRFVKFEGGFCVELLRKALTTIRETVGDDVFILSCGAPTLLGAGILNGARMSCDIIWGKNKDQPSYWQIMKDCVKTVGWRYFFHRKVYINDPDGVVLRDLDFGDGFNCTWAEAELWSIAVAMSGGAVLSNDELENLSPARRELYTQLLPPLDIPGHAVDHFEQPEPSAYVVEVDENTKFLAVYNLGDTMIDMTYALDKVGMSGALVYDCRRKAVLGIKDEIKIENANPHSGCMYLLRRLPDVPAFVASDANIYGGINLIKSAWSDEALIFSRPESHKDAAVFVVYPDGFEPEGEVVMREQGYTVTRR